MRLVSFELMLCDYTSDYTITIEIKTRAQHFHLHNYVHNSKKQQLTNTISPQPPHIATYIRIYNKTFCD